MRGDVPARDPGEPLLQRAEELDHLRNAIEGLAEGTGGVHLIEGGAGIGKSRLLSEARAAAVASGLRSLTARGGELEGEFAFGVVRQLFERLVLAPDAGARWLQGPAAAATLLFEGSADLESAGVGAPFAVLNGLYWLVVNLAAEGPLLLTVDDLQWCDTSSLRCLAYLVRRLEDLPVLLIACVRTSRTGTDPSLVAEIANDPATVRLRPDPLGEGPTAELITRRLGREPARSFVTACRQATGGNPLLLHELLRALSVEGVIPDEAHVEEIQQVGPRAVARTVLYRLARLSADAITVARAVSILGEGATLSTICRLTRLTEGTAATGCQALVDAEILRPEQPLGFIHPLVREAVYHDMAPVERERVHTHAARLLYELEVPTEQIAAQLLMVSPGSAAWIVDLLRDASREAMRKGAPESAVAYLRRALAEPPPAPDRPGLLLELGMDEALVDGPAASEHLRAALGGLATAADRALAVQKLAHILFFTNAPEEARAVAEAAAAELPAGFADLRLEFEASALCAALFVAPQLGGSRKLVEARAMPVPDSVGARRMAAVAAWGWALTGGPSDACVKLALNSLEGGNLIGAVLPMSAFLAIGVVALAGRDEAPLLLEAAVTEARVQGSLDATAGALLWSGWTWLERGELAEAEDCLTQALDMSQLWNPRGGQGLLSVTGWLARVLIERGDLRAARALLKKGPNPVPGSAGDNFCLRSRIELLLAEGAASEALVEADRYATQYREIENPAWAPWASLRAIALSRAGRMEEASELLVEELAQARRWGAPGPVGRALRLLGSLRRREGLDLLQEAVEVTAPGSARLEHAKALAGLGAALRHSRHPTEARDPLRRALELATRGGAGPLVALARSELLASGARPRGRDLAGVGSLTPSERRVVEMAATGRTNREIAESLYVTPKTVEIHLSSSYLKLGIRSRRDLAAALMTSG